jgi:pimeloyl-ACP methyl ester carboxylesterase
MTAGALSLFELARSDPHALRDVMAALASSPVALLETMAASMPAGDQRLIAARRESFEADFAELLRGGIEGIARDFELIAGEWTFPLAEIQTSVDLWSGTEDCNTPPAMSRHLAAVLPHARLLELPDEGHWCLYSRWHEILDRLMF